MQIRIEDKGAVEGRSIYPVSANGRKQSSPRRDVIEGRHEQKGLAWRCVDRGAEDSAR